MWLQATSADHGGPVIVIWESGLQEPCLVGGQRATPVKAQMTTCVARDHYTGIAIAMRPRLGSQGVPSP